MDIVIVTAIIASLFVIIGAAEPLAARLRLPYTVILALLGILIGGAAIFFLRTSLTDALNPVAEAILSFPIRSNVFLYVLLPTLIFQPTLDMNIRRMFDDWVPILVMAVLAVVAATVSVGYALHWASSLPLVVCLLTGAIVSTTDPSAVVGIFRSISAPQRLTRIIEGESLLNDAAAIALFGLFLGSVMFSSSEPQLGTALRNFPVLIIGGVVAGWIVARAGLAVMRLATHYPLAQLSITVALPYLAYIGAEEAIGASGVIAVVSTGLMLNLHAPGRLPPEAMAKLREMWNLLAHWSGALIFILAALLVPRLLEEVRADDFLLVGIVIIAATAARALMLFGLLPLLTALRLSPPIDRNYRSAILWGGLRGAVTLTLALAVTENFFVPAEVKRVVAILATGYTLFTLIVQGSSLRWLIGALGLDRLSPIDQALSNQVVAVALQTVREDVAKTTEDYELTREIARSEAKRFAERLDRAVEAAEADAEILDRDRIALGLIALTSAERDGILDHVRERIISGRLSEHLLSDAERLIEAVRAEGRIGYQRAARRSISYGRGFRLVLFIHNRLHWSSPLARLTVDRFERLLAQRLILRDLGRFIDRRILRIHGRRVAELLHELLSRRREAVETALDGLRLQYPGYAEEVERRFVRRTALRLEEHEYGSLKEDGLIGDELFTVLMSRIAAERTQTEHRPALDLALQKAELVRQFPLFAEIDETAHRLLTRALVSRYANEGEVILRRDATARSVFFIASGAVELETAGQTWRLGRGEMFGQMSILSNGPRRTMVRAIAPSTFLVLDDTRFRRLLRQSTALREAVRESAHKRGIPTETLLPEIG
ncbi:cation:proton antiporter [Solirhodobacter olei]|uniref:cation:proton antiporter n=1 Tax=Solirhodobacter olei TaxID=2493082 RepID=UPI000FD82AF5|nr:cation:proton antiporter [Solirhodobacter olei]